MNLYIAEKPSLARAIADVLPKPHKREDGYIRVGNGDCVSWCVGHLLEHVEPDSYDPKYKQWRLEHLPILPSQWRLQAKPKTKKQLSVLKKLLNQADQLIHAGDPDREGQLLVDQVIAFHQLPEKKIKSVKRCLINDLNPSAVKRAIEQLRENIDFVPLSTSALARTRADWLYGINLTRAYTVQGRKVGYDGVLSVGRVQTPLLGLVVRRDLEIEKFVPKPFYDVMAHLQTDGMEVFTVKWRPSEACRPHMDEEGRVLNKKLAENVVERIDQQSATVIKVDEQLRKQSAPLLFSLSALQIAAARRYGLSASQVLDHCQSLYERHKLLTYPRSDSRHMPEEHFTQADKVITAIAYNSEKLEPAANDANPALKSQVWNDKKVDAHHAIIPTLKKAKLTSLSEPEKQIYELVARQYLYQFYPKHEYFETKLEVMIKGGLFTANAKRNHVVGWKQLMISSISASKPMQNILYENDKSLPELKVGQLLTCIQADLLEKETQAPRYFTDATLLTAMTGIARYVKDPNIRKVLRETDGLGTEATRASIIELLFKRGYLKRDKKLIRSTQTGRGLIQSLPESATRPDMTAEWESNLNAISERQSNYQAFMQPLTQSIQSLVDQSRATLPVALKGIKSNQPAFRKKKKSKKS